MRRDRVRHRVGERRARWLIARPDSNAASAIRRRASSRRIAPSGPAAPRGRGRARVRRARGHRRRVPVGDRLEALQYASSPEETVTSQPRSEVRVGSTSATVREETGPCDRELPRRRLVPDGRERCDLAPGAGRRRHRHHGSGAAPGQPAESTRSCTDAARDARARREHLAGVHRAAASDGHDGDRRRRAASATEASSRSRPGFGSTRSWTSTSGPIEPRRALRQAPLRRPRCRDHERPADRRRAELGEPRRPRPRCASG